MLFRRSEVDGPSIFYCEAGEQAALKFLTTATTGSSTRRGRRSSESGSRDDIPPRGRDVFFTREGGETLPEDLPRRGNARLNSCRFAVQDYCQPLTGR
jgi:hypothetical protein